MDSLLDHLDQYREEVAFTSTLTPNSRRSYLYRLAQLERFLRENPEASKVNLSNGQQLHRILSEFLSHLTTQRGMSARSVQATTLTVSHFLRSKDVPWSPSVAAVAEEMQETLSDAEWHRIYQMVCSIKSYRDRSLLLLLMTTGISLKHCRGLRWSHVIEALRTGGFSDAFGRGARFVRLCPELSSSLERHMAESGVWAQDEDTESAVFANKAGAALSRSAIDHMIKSSGFRLGMVLSARLLTNSARMRIVRDGSAVPGEQISPRLRLVRRIEEPAAPVVGENRAIGYARQFFGNS